MIFATENQIFVVAVDGENITPEDAMVKAFFNKFQLKSPGPATTRRGQR